MNNCPDCMTNEEAVGEGVRCARHEIDFLRAALVEKEKELAKFPNNQCPSCGFPKEDPVDGYVGMKSRAEAAESLVQKICRESGVVLFQDGEVRNHRAEKAEKALADRESHISSLAESLLAMEKEAQGLRMEWSAAKGAAISYRLRAEAAERENQALREERDARESQWRTRFDYLEAKIEEAQRHLDGVLKDKYNQLAAQAQEIKDLKEKLAMTEEILRRAI